MAAARSRRLRPDGNTRVPPMTALPGGNPLDELSRVRRHHTFAALLVTTAVGLGLLAPRVQAVIDSVGSMGFAIELASLTLLVATLLYLSSWWFGTDDELGAIAAVGPDLLAVVPGYEFGIVVLTALALIALAAATVLPLAFVSVYASIKLIELGASASLRETIEENEGRLSKQKRQRLSGPIEEIKGYYLRRPWARLTALVLFILIGAIGVGAYLAGATTGSAYQYTMAAIAVPALTAMALNEAFTWRWRRAYVRRLRTVVLPTDDVQAPPQPGREVTPARVGRPSDARPKPASKRKAGH